MRLVSRLVLSHALPVGLMVCALVVMLGSLAQISSSLKEVRDAELGSLNTEEAVHRAAWAVEIAVRHGAVDCENGQSSENAARVIQQRLRDLDAVLQAAEKPVREIMLEPVRGYQALATRVSTGDTCAHLVTTTTRLERERLDEKLTDAWIARMFELHSALLRKDEESGRAAGSALSSGIVLALVACVVAVLLAQRISRTVTQPLASLSSSVRSVGRGDFTVTIEAQGPREVYELAEEMEVMRRRLAELESLKQGFLASVSHEMRTPLTKIREALALLSDGAGGKLNERQARIVQIAQLACEREIRTVTTLLDLSRLRAGVPLQRKPGASVDEVLWSAVRDEESEARERGVTVDVETPGQAAKACLDMVLVERAIANIVRNAVAVSKKGQHVYVRRDLVPEGPGGHAGTWAQISVADQGPGIPPEIRSVIFDAFVTHSVESSPKRVGIGLGLALAREIARAHGGDIEASDDPSGGAVFRMWLPLDEEPPSPRALPAHV
ncbi:HAMP domain-containing sensor histidine kinase [Polyangium sp. y55x31]|uniref:HAMP domain-containing sensor histidine kinase n=1 Tax=Polyangium sp. y55x31 TaxID=3042688 RepID=UPI0024825BD5|nr:HAMP domain-containing sensor histidine kinase [Polyangium sp. y55x31]MDI1475157.1 HAMP domain-containing sensor histidine kinase [Polyangium sp. y55x31]